MVSRSLAQLFQMLHPASLLRNQLLINMVIPGLSFEKETVLAKLQFCMGIGIVSMSKQQPGSSIWELEGDC